MTEHSSMLVNASRFTDVQRQIRNEIHERLERIQASARVYGALPPSDALKDPEICALHDVFAKEYAGAGFAWDAVQQKLNDAAAPIKAVEVNSRSSGTLNYADHNKTGLSVIAVGGFSLSRGLTLEGLMISYFLRNSIMYDTLMQMGRWFGYRPDYDDLCRIWMLDDAEGWYRHVAESIEELRDELRMMEAANATPREFGLKVRSHPTTLEVTARNKMGSGQTVVVQIGLSNEFIETTQLRRDQTSLDTNRQAARNLADGLGRSGFPLAKAARVDSGWLITGAGREEVLRFLGEWRNAPGSMITETGPVRRYIEERAETELSKWDILFASLVKEDADTTTDTSLGVPIILQSRSLGKKSDARAMRITDNQRVASRGVERTGLSDDEIEQARAEYRKNNPEKAKAKTINYPDRIYRTVRKRPLLIIHLLKVMGENPPPAPVVAWSISFPSTATPENRVEYVVNTTWMRENYREEVDEEELLEDDNV
jgi:hypothetical protein